MAEYDKFAIGLAVILASVGIFIGVRTFVKKSFETPPFDYQNIYHSRPLRLKQKRHIQDIHKRQKRLMESQKQRIKDMRR